MAGWAMFSGLRKTLIRIVLWWSFFTAITGAVGLKVGGLVLGGVATLQVVRFLFGMGEAGAYPNITRALHNWYPRDKRGFTQGMVWMSGRLMGGLTPIIWTLLISGVVWKGERITPSLMNWRTAFWLFGIMGLVLVRIVRLVVSQPSRAEARSERCRTRADQCRRRQPRRGRVGRGALA